MSVSCGDGLGGDEGSDSSSSCSVGSSPVSVSSCGLGFVSVAFRGPFFALFRLFFLARGLGAFFLSLSGKLAPPRLESSASGIDTDEDASDVFMVVAARATAAAAVTFLMVATFCEHVIALVSLGATWHLSEVMSFQNFALLSLFDSFD